MTEFSSRSWPVEVKAGGLMISRQLSRVRCFMAIRTATIIGLSTLFVLALSAWSQQDPAKKPAPLPKAPAGVVIQENVTYLAKGRTETADLYLPAKRDRGVRSPAVVIIHGGGFTGGDKAAAREFNIGTTLALNGYVAMSVNYALASKDHPTWPRNVQDCMTAVRWLRKNADHLQIDVDHIGTIGGSAGGHLAAMLAVAEAKDGLDPAGPYAEFSCRVQCAVPMYGAYDFTDRNDLVMIGKTREQAPEAYRAASPIVYLNQKTPPMLLLCGTADSAATVAQSERFAAALKKAGVEHELVLVEKAPHSFHLEPKQRDLRPLVLGFFDKHLKRK
jgi:acetyl esterase/lipase